MCFGAVAIGKRASGRRELPAFIPLTLHGIRNVGHRYQQGECNSPPEGRARWTVRLVAEEAVKRKLVPRAGRETIRILLLSHDLRPWREKIWGSGRSG
jgi:hypothetical protein